ncbi:MAG: hypothetical protein ACREDA_00525 [Methylocella sp.]
MDRAMGSAAIGFSNDGIAGVSVDSAMLCYRQSEEKSAKAPLAHKAGVVRGNPILGKMFQYAGSAAHGVGCSVEDAALGLLILDADCPRVES